MADNQVSLGDVIEGILNSDLTIFQEYIDDLQINDQAKKDLSSALNKGETSTIEQILKNGIASGIAKTFNVIATSLDHRDGVELFYKNIFVIESIASIENYRQLLDVLVGEVSKMRGNPFKLSLYMDNITRIQELLKSTEAALDEFARAKGIIGGTAEEIIENAFPNTTFRTKVLKELGGDVAGSTLSAALMIWHIDQQTEGVGQDQKNIIIAEEIIGGVTTELASYHTVIKGFIEHGSVGPRLTGLGFGAVTSRLIVANVGLSLWYGSFRYGGEAIFRAAGLYDNEWFIQNSDAIIQYFENSNTEEEREPIIHLVHILKLLDPSLSDDTLQLMMGTSVSMMGALLESDPSDPRFMHYEMAKLALTQLIEVISGQAPAEFSSPETFMAEIGKNFRDFSDYRGKLTFDFTAMFLNDYSVKKAMGDGGDALAYRYALVKGYPFVILGIDYSQYADQLSLYDPNTGTGLLTEQYLKDRSNFISTWAYGIRIDDSDGIISAPLGVPVRVRDLIYSELETGKKVGLDGLDLGILDPDQVIFGTENDDKKKLTGSAADDRIYGGAGEDTLNGKGGNNYLEGGAGFDTYEVGEGVDTILDIDGQGEIILNGKKLTEANYVGGAASGGDVWEDADGNVYMRKGNDLLILNKKGSSGGGSTGGTGSGTNGGGPMSGEGGTPPDNTGSGTNGGGSNTGSSGTNTGPSTGSSYNDLLTVKDFFKIATPYGQSMKALDIELKAKPEPEKPNTDLNKVPSSPLILSPDKNAVLTTSILHGVYFDLDNNGHKEWTAWTLQGILCFDIDEDGVISNGGELFGNHTILKNGQKAANGFEALKEKDSNHDGKIDENDELYHKLLIWFDRNQDGISQPDEIMTLIEAGVKGIDLNYKNTSYVDSNGNSHKQQGSYTLADGSIANITDVWFQSDLSNTKDNSKLTWSDEVAKLTNLSGLGNAHDLRNAMMLDTTGRLISLVIQLTKALEGNTPFEYLTDQINALIFEWTGVSQYASNSRGANIDGRVMYALEVFYGQKFIEHATHTNPSAKAASVLKEVYNSVFQYVLDSFMFDFKIKPLLDSIIFELNDKTHQINFDISNMLNKMKKEFEYNSKDYLHIFRALKNALDQQGELGTEVLNQLIKSGKTETGLFGQLFDLVGGNSNIHAITALGKDALIDLGLIQFADAIIGGAKGGTLQGSGADDILIGGVGNDRLVGNTGSDTYVFSKGHGQDIVSDNGDGPNGYTRSSGIIDTIKLTDVNFAEVKFARDGNNLIIFDYNGSDQVTIEKIISDQNYRIDVFQFADRKVTLNELWADGLPLYSREGDTVVTGWAGSNHITGGSEDQTITTYGYNDVIYTGAGNNIVYAGAGNDMIYSGSGNNFLQGGKGSDTYVFAKGHGQDIVSDNGDAPNGNIRSVNIVDTIKFTDVNFAEAKFARDGNNLIIFGYNGSDQITIERILSDQNYRIDVFQFADQTISLNELMKSGLPIYSREGDAVINGWGYANIVTGGSEDQTITTYGYNDVIYTGAGNNIVYTGAGNDTIYSGSGNNFLQGGTGSDTYVFSKGHGQDIVSDNGDAPNGKIRSVNIVDTIKFTDVNFADVKFARDGNNLIIFGYNGSDQVTIEKILTDQNYRIDMFQFADQTLSLNELMKSGLPIYSREGDTVINGWGYANIVTGGSEDQTITTYGYSDVIRTGGGNNTVYAGAGNDAIYSGSGNNFLQGGTGSDTYVFSKGHGQDIVADNGDGPNGYTRSSSIVDTIKFTDVNFADVKFARDGNNLIIFGYNGSDKITVEYLFSHQNYRIDKFQFNDKTISYSELIKTSIPAFTAEDQANLLTAQAELDAARTLSQVMSPASYLMTDEFSTHNASPMGMSALNTVESNQAQADIAKEVQSLISAMASFGATEGSIQIDDQTYGYLTPITASNY